MRQLSSQFETDFRNCKKERARKWWILGASFSVFFAEAGIVNSLPVFYPFLIQSFGWTRALTTAAGSIATLSNGLVNPLVGWICDRFGVRRVLLSGVIVMAISLCGLASANSLTQLYLSTLLMGLGHSAMGLTPNQVLIARWFDTKFGMASGIFMSAAGLGAAAFPPMTNLIIEKVDWRLAALVLAAVTLVAPLTIILALIRDRQLEKLSPSSSRDLAIGETALESFKRANPKQQSFAQLLKSPVFWLIAIPLFFCGVAINGVLHHYVLYLRDKEFTASSAALTFSFVGMGRIPGQVLAGILYDRVFRPRVVALYALLSLVTLSTLMIGESGFFAFLITFLFGFCFGPVIMSMPLLVQKAFGRENFGKALGTVFLFHLLGASIGPVLMGLAFDSFQTYVVALIVMSLLIGVATVIISSLLYGSRAELFLSTELEGGSANGSGAKFEGRR